MLYSRGRCLALGLLVVLATTSEATQRSRKALSSSRKKVRTAGSVESELYPEIESSVKNSTGRRLHRADPEAANGEDKKDLLAENQCDYPTVKRSTLANYAASIRPHKGGEPERVSVGLDVESIGNLDSKTQSLAVDIFVRMRWLDPRLQFSSACRRIGDKTGETWQPDWYIANSAEVMDKIKGMESAFMYPNGTVTYSVRVIGKVKCAMNFKKFPFDSQRCPIKIASTVLGKKQQLFLVEAGDEPITYGVAKSKLGGTEWNFESGSVHVADAPAPTPAPKKGEFHVSDPSASKSRVDFSFGLSRFSDSYMKDFVIPVSMMFLMCWCGFVLDMKFTPPLPARAAIAIIPVLIMTTQTASSKQSIPRIDYTTWLSEMLTISLMFMVYGLVELVLVFYGCKRYNSEIARIAKKDYNHDKGEGAWENLADKERAIKIRLYAEHMKNDSKMEKPGFIIRHLRNLDLYSLFAFPLSAAIFAITMYAEANSMDNEI